MDQNKTENPNIGSNTSNDSSDSLEPQAAENSSVLSNETGAVGENNQPEDSGTEDLETPSTQENSANSAVNNALPGNTTLATNEKVKEKKHIKRGIEKLTGLNIYLLGFVLLIVIACIGGFLAYSRNQKEEAKQESLITEPLSQEVLDQLKQTDVRVGDPKQILSIESNAVFAGKVLIRDSLEIAGQLKIGGPLELPGIKVAGASSFDQLQGRTLDISGNSNIQGQLAVGGGASIGGNLSVSGSLTAGQLTIQNLQVSGDLKIARHIDAGGGSPGLSRGNALGGGGTASVSGTDTAGTVNVNTGSGPGSGCFATLTFSQRFNDTPHVVITPVGGAAANVRYYVNRSSSGFSVCTATSAPSGQSFAFDYIVIE
jgi:hypothetical protein